MVSTLGVLRALQALCYSVLATLQPASIVPIHRWGQTRKVLSDFLSV